VYSFSYSYFLFLLFLFVSLLSPQNKSEAEIEDEMKQAKIAQDEAEKQVRNMYAQLLLIKDRHQELENVQKRMRGEYDLGKASTLSSGSSSEGEGTDSDYKDQASPRTRGRWKELDEMERTESEHNMPTICPMSPAPSAGRYPNKYSSSSSQQSNPMSRALSNSSMGLPGMNPTLSPSESAALKDSEERFPSFEMWDLFGRSIKENKRVNLRDPILQQSGMSAYQIIQMRNVFRICRRQWALAVQVVNSLQLGPSVADAQKMRVALNIPDWENRDQTIFKACDNCQCRFSFFTRRHHCRLCGSIFCYDCCWKKLNLSSILTHIRKNGILRQDEKFLSNIRTCETCAVVMHSVLRNRHLGKLRK